jgi:hypothetical protein
MKTVTLLAIFAIVASLGVVGTTSMSLIQPAQAFSDVQSCQHFYHFFAGAVGNSHCGKGQQ